MYMRAIRINRFFQSPVFRRFLLRLPLLTGILFLTGTFVRAAAIPPQMWYRHNSYLTSPSAGISSEAIIDQAATAGYTGMVLWDSAINGLNVPGWNNSYLQQVATYAASKGLQLIPYVAPFGNSGFESGGASLPRPTICRSP